MLAGFRSRCSTPRSCAAASPAQICRAISIALSSGSRPMRRSSDDRSSPSTYSIVRNSCAVDLADVVDAADVGVRHLPRRPHFVVELREPHGIARRGLGQELQRDLLAEPQVVGAIDLAHAAAAEQPEDAVAAVEHRAGRETGRDRSSRTSSASRRRTLSASTSKFGLVAGRVVTTAAGRTRVGRHGSERYIMPHAVRRRDPSRTIRNHRRDRRRRHGRGLSRARYASSIATSRIKVLPRRVRDTIADRLARFQREAQVLASLNHPNIAAIYGLEEAATDPARRARWRSCWSWSKATTSRERLPRGPIAARRRAADRAADRRRRSKPRTSRASSIAI